MLYLDLSYNDGNCEVTTLIEISDIDLIKQMI